VRARLKALAGLMVLTTVVIVTPSQAGAEIVDSTRTPTVNAASNGDSASTAIVRAPDGGVVAQTQRYSGGGHSDWSCGYMEDPSGPKWDHTLYGVTPVKDFVAGDILKTAPPAEGDLIVGLRTWFWLDQRPQPITASVTLAGITATVEARPTTITIDPGDNAGGRFTCPDAGTPYDPSHPDAPSTCTYVYDTRSTVDDRNGRFQATVQVDYDVTWRATDGTGGPLQPLHANTTLPLLVREVQALIN
jgi:hypothetical protein